MGVLLYICYMKNEKSVIFCDVDDVVANLCGEWVRLYNAEYGDTLQQKNVTDWDISKFVKPECGDDIFKYLWNDNLYQGVEPIDGASEGIMQLRDLGYRVVFATSCNLKMAGQKLQWLDDYGFLSMDKRGVCKDYIEISDKHLLLGDTLIDDYHHNLNGFQGRRILFNASHNLAISQNDFTFSRAANWEEVVKKLEINRFKLINL